MVCMPRCGGANRVASWGWSFMKSARCRAGRDRDSAGNCIFSPFSAILPPAFMILGAPAFPPPLVCHSGSRSISRRFFFVSHLSPNEAFASLPLAPELLANLDSLGYGVMTPIQAGSLPLMLGGRDVIAQAKTGSGKTAAFGLGLLSRLVVTRFCEIGRASCRE